MATFGKWTTGSTGKALEDPSGLGRWSGLTYLGKPKKWLTVITAYRCPCQQTSAGYGFYDQPYALLLSQGVRKSNFWRQFRADLIKFINNLPSAGHEIFPSLDANKILGQEKTFGIGHLLDECTLFDLHCLGPAVLPATYKDGSDRKINFIQASGGLLPPKCGVSRIRQWHFLQTSRRFHRSRFPGTQGGRSILSLPLQPDNSTLKNQV